MYAVAKIISLFYYSTLPFVEGNFTPLIPHEADNGFPSDHTLLGAGISSVIYFFNKKVSAVLWALTLIVGISRVYAGVHHPVDIVGSIIVALAATVIIYGLILARKRGKIGENKGA
jgi:undecaprenyl-diphosphatase